MYAGWRRGQNHNEVVCLKAALPELSVFNSQVLMQPGWEIEPSAFAECPAHAVVNYIGRSLIARRKQVRPLEPRIQHRSHTVAKVGTKSTSSSLPLLSHGPLQSHVPLEVLVVLRIAVQGSVPPRHALYHLAPTAIAHRCHTRDRAAHIKTNRCAKVLAHMWEEVTIEALRKGWLCCREVEGTLHACGRRVVHAGES